MLTRSISNFFYVIYNWLFSLLANIPLVLSEPFDEPFDFYLNSEKIVNLV